jgi:hypothetical protein
MNHICCFMLSAILLIVWPLQAMERPPVRSSDGLWRHVTEQEIGSLPERTLVPRVSQPVRLDVEAFLNLVADAPLELTGAAADATPVMTLPLPDGSYARFRVEESPIMEPDLAALLPNVRTYRAVGVDIPEATARLDFTPDGFHGFILAPAGAVYIDPYGAGDIEHYITFWDRDFEPPADARPFRCDSVEEHAQTLHLENRVMPDAARGPQLRTYRLALACTGEYAAYYGGTVAGAQSGMVTTMNRVNGIYEKEFAIRMVMVNNTSVCFINGASDPYANNSSTPDLAANQATLDANIGSPNYDVGHLFGTGPGGSAYRAYVCNATYKGQGQTGLSVPAGDVFNVGYVAHEMGHQFGARHSFNGTTGGCGIVGGRNAVSAYEPGGGSTIMAYGGLCGSESLQSYKDPYFHAISFDEIVAFTSSIACGTQPATGNAAPVPVAGPAFIIPISTPFYLTGSATDADNDPLTYGWEQFDLGTFSPPNTDNGNRPIFRSFNPVTTPIRTFPRLQDLRANTTTLGESLPTTTRTLTFRFTVRDNRTGTNTTSRTVSVTDTAGPFVVTAPNTNVSWSGGSTQNVTWNVAGTTAAPVSCANVKILLSIDGGNTFPTTLLAGTPNDGSQPVTVAAATTSAARVRVECVTAPFFDISNVDFSISTPLTVVATATTATNVALSYTAIANAASYEIHRRTGGGAFVLIGTSATNSFNDATASPNKAYLYAVKSIGSGGASSPLSSPDLATTAIFTDPALIARVTRIKGAHVTELRAAINAVRGLAGMGDASFTDPALAGRVAKTTHIAELRTALNTALSTLGLPAPGYTDASLTVRTTRIRVAHVEELRNALK